MGKATSNTPQKPDTPTERLQHALNGLRAFNTSMISLEEKMARQHARCQKISEEMKELGASLAHSNRARQIQKNDAPFRHQGQARPS